MRKKRELNLNYTNLSEEQRLKLLKLLAKKDKTEDEENQIKNIFAIIRTQKTNKKDLAKKIESNPEIIAANEVEPTISTAKKRKSTHTTHQSASIAKKQRSNPSEQPQAANTDKPILMMIPNKNQIISLLENEYDFNKSPSEHPDSQKLLNKYKDQVGRHHRHMQIYITKCRELLPTKLLVN